MRNNEPLHQLQQCLRDNGEKIAAAVNESQFREVLAVNTELRAEVEQLKVQQSELKSVLETCMDYAANTGDQMIYDQVEAALSRIEVK